MFLFTITNLNSYLIYTKKDKFNVKHKITTLQEEGRDGVSTFFFELQNLLIRPQGTQNRGRTEQKPNKAGQNNQRNKTKQHNKRKNTPETQRDQEENRKRGGKTTSFAKNN